MSETRQSSSRVPGPSATGEPHLVCEDVSKWFGDVEVLDGISFTVPREGRVALLGPSGSGKSTLLMIAAGLIEESAGRLSIGGDEDQKGRLQHCALMPQKDLLFAWRTARDNVALPLENLGMRKKTARERVMPMFEKAGLGGFEERRPYELSGGMRQRVSFLRTLVAEKDVLLLDEPFGALDSLTRAEMQAWLLSIVRQASRTMLLVTHDVEEALLLADVVIVLSARPGRVVAKLVSDFPEGENRRETVSGREFVDLKDQALAALEC
jgi:ABC-type nitrate/sulfonate/bicarbonate transport system ATPase subunit